MKKIVLIAVTALAISACSHDKKQEKATLDQILAIHDKVMGSDELLMKNKMQLDTLLKQKTADSVEVKALSSKLTAAEDAMDGWMHKFEPDVTGKSHDQIITYYSDQKKQIMAVDSQLNTAITLSVQYLQKTKKK